MHTGHRASVPWESAHLRRELARKCGKRSGWRNRTPMYVGRQASGMPVRSHRGRRLKSPSSSMEVDHMKRLLPALSLAAAVPLALALPLAAQAQSADGYVIADASLRAGPAPDYPEIDSLPYGSYVSVQGCTEGWEWCDVIAPQQGDRGWVAGDYIEYIYDDQPVLLPEYGPRIGIPIVTFVITDYWNAHYRNRPFYRERDTWFHRNIPPRAPPAPPPRPGNRPPPPPPPGGWHHGHAPNPSREPVNVPQHTRGDHHANMPAPPVGAPPRRMNPPNAPQAPIEPPHPGGDHHANVPTPPMGAPPHPAPPRMGNAPQPQHPMSNASQGNRPPPKQEPR